MARVVDFENQYFPNSIGEDTSSTSYLDTSSYTGSPGSRSSSSSDDRNEVYSSANDTSPTTSDEGELRNFHFNFNLDLNASGIIKSEPITPEKPLHSSDPYSHHDLDIDNLPDRCCSSEECDNNCPIKLKLRSLLTETYRREEELLETERKIFNLREDFVNCSEDFSSEKILKFKEDVPMLLQKLNRMATDLRKEKRKVQQKYNHYIRRK